MGGSCWSRCFWPDHWQQGREPNGATLASRTERNGRTLEKEPGSFRRHFGEKAYSRLSATPTSTGDDDVSPRLNWKGFIKSFRAGLPDVPRLQVFLRPQKGEGDPSMVFLVERYRAPTISVRRMLPRPTLKFVANGGRTGVAWTKPEFGQRGNLVLTRPPSLHPGEHTPLSRFSDQRAWPFRPDSTGPPFDQVGPSPSTSLARVHEPGTRRGWRALRALPGRCRARCAFGLVVVTPWRRRARLCRSSSPGRASTTPLERAWGGVGGGW